MAVSSVFVYVMSGIVSWLHAGEYALWLQLLLVLITLVCVLGVLPSSILYHDYTLRLRRLLSRVSSAFIEKVRPVFYSTLLTTVRTCQGNSRTWWVPVLVVCVLIGAPYLMGARRADGAIPLPSERCARSLFLC